MRCSDETRKKISESLTGKKLSEGHKQKLSEAKRGKPKSEKWKQSMRGRTLSEEHKKKISEHNGRHWSGVHLSDETKQKLSESHKGKSPWNLGISPARETRRQISSSVRKLWKNEEYAKNAFKNLHITPNGCELYLDYMLQNNFPDEWKFVGDGQVIIGGLCPDFINVNGKKKIIELFGKHWHHGTHIRPNQTEDSRKIVFKEFGFDMLVIWDYELINAEKTMEKIRTFSDL